MADGLHRHRLQPSLRDRLDDDLRTAVAELRRHAGELERRLDEPHRAALAALMDEERLLSRPLRPDDLLPFADLDDETRGLVPLVLRLERERLTELRRVFAISPAGLRRAVLRDLQDLFDCTAAECLLVEEEGREIGLFEGFPRARASVLNYGIPALAGRIRTSDDFNALARDLERAIEHFEPRLRRVRVSVEGVHGSGLQILESPVTLVIEGELWAYPLHEMLRVRTVLDLELGRARVEGAEAA